MRPKKRWYDGHPKLSELLESLNPIRGRRRNNIISGIMEIIKQRAPALFDRYVLDFPLNIKRRRWYDRDPYLWLIINGLKYGNKQLLTAVTTYLQENIGKKKSNRNPTCARKG